MIKLLFNWCFKSFDLFAYFLLLIGFLTLNIYNTCNIWLDLKLWSHFWSFLILIVDVIVFICLEHLETTERLKDLWNKK